MTNNQKDQNMLLQTEASGDTIPQSEVALWKYWMSSEQRKSEIVNRLQAITRMPPKITRNFQFLIMHITNGLYVYWNTYSCFVSLIFCPAICSNMEKFVLPREDGPILVTHTM